MINHITEARDDTLIHRAPRDQLRELNELYGLPVPPTRVPYPSQRAFCHEALYSVRGSRTALISALRGLFSHLSVKGDATLTPGLSPSMTGSVITSAWGEQRLIYTDQGLFSSTHYDAATSRLYLSPARSMQITPAPATGSPQTLEVELLPFVVVEPSPARSISGRSIAEQCTVIIELIAPDERIVPPSYWRENADAGTHNKKNFYAFFNEHDRRRLTRFLNTFPEMEDFWMECKNAK